MSPESSDVVFLEHFRDLEDPHQSGKVAYPLPEILLLCLCGILSGADSWVEIAEWGKAQLNYLCQFLPFEKGLPSHDTLGDLFRRLDADKFRDCFIAWVNSFQKGLRKTVAIDGKALRHALDENQNPIYLVSAWASD